MRTFDAGLNRQKKFIAIIPARSGSKGLKDKNIRELNGKPLIAYTIESALSAGIFDIVHVSTDSKKYADIATSFGADVPFLRSVECATDRSSPWDAVREVLSRYKELGKEFDVCALLQPTSPLRTAQDICEAFSLYFEKNARSLTSVSEVEHPVQWCFKLDETLSMQDFSASPYKECRRQELEKHYRENGMIYIVGAEDICRPGFSFYTADCYAYIVEQRRAIDIDALQDFILAKTLMRTEEA